MAALSLIVDVRTFLPGLLGHLSGDNLMSKSWPKIYGGLKCCERGWRNLE